MSFPKPSLSLSLSVKNNSFYFFSAFFSLVFVNTKRKGQLVFKSGRRKNRHTKVSFALSLSLSLSLFSRVVNFRHHRQEEEKEERILTTTMGLLRRARKSNPSGTEGGKSAPQSSRIEERLRTARILAEEDDDDDELHGRSKRTKAQIERDLSDPRVHKRIVENLYGAYKSRVRFRSRERRIFVFRDHIF